jgi:hypothetical protein
MAKVKILPGTEAKEIAHELSAADTYLNERGHELPSGVPMAPPLGYKKQPSLHETIRNMIRSERLAQEAATAGFETFDEADDFDVGDDLDPSSPYELEFEGDLLPPPPSPSPTTAPQMPAGGSPATTPPVDTKTPS